MPDIRHVAPRKSDALLLVSTMKGLFILRESSDRSKWSVGGPWFPGSPVYAAAYDDREGRTRIWAGPMSWHWGAVLRSSDDFGRTWTDPERANVSFPKSTGASLRQIWQILRGRHVRHRRRREDLARVERRRARGVPA